MNQVHFKFRVGNISTFFTSSNILVQFHQFLKMVSFSAGYKSANNQRQKNLSKCLVYFRHIRTKQRCTPFIPICTNLTDMMITLFIFRLNLVFWLLWNRTKHTFWGFLVYAEQDKSLSGKNGVNRQPLAQLQKDFKMMRVVENLTTHILNRLVNWIKLECDGWEFST